MVKYIKLFLIVALWVHMTSCEVVAEGFKYASEATNYLADGYSKYVENGGDDFLNLNNHAQAWQKGNVGKGIVLAELGVEFAEEFTGKDLSIISSALKNTRNSYNRDTLSGSNNTTDIILYGGGAVYEYFTEKSWQENLDAFYEEVAIASDPESPFYDPYFEYRYEVDYENRIIKKRDRLDVIADIGSLHFDTPTYSYTEEYINEEIVETPSQESMPEIEESMDEETSMSLESPQPTTIGNTTNINNFIIDKYPFNICTLSSEQKQLLDNLAEILATNPTIQITIIGHTCYIGSDKANNVVGLKRAINAKKYLIDCGIDDERIEVKSMGAKEPVVNSKDAQSLLANRRITFSVN